MTTDNRMEDYLENPTLMSLPAELSLDELARIIHSKDFGEEYDFMFDDTIDGRTRKKGGNPMQLEYIDKYTHKRKALVVEPLTENGMTTDGMPSKSSFDISHKRAEEFYDEQLKKTQTAE